MTDFLILFQAILLSIIPVSELRGGITYAVLNGINPVLAFLVCTFANIAVIFFIFFFLDFFHKRFVKISFYEKTFNFYLRGIRKRIDDFEKKFAIYGFFALTIFVAIPLPATGAWTGAFIAWLLDLDRKKSILAIALGVLIAGIIVLLANLGIITIFRFV